MDSSSLTIMIAILPTEYSLSRNRCTLKNYRRCAAAIPYRFTIRGISGLINSVLQLHQSTVEII